MKINNNQHPYWTFSTTQNKTSISSTKESKRNLQQTNNRIRKITQNTTKETLFYSHLYVFINAGANWCCFFTKPQTTTISLFFFFILSPFQNKKSNLWTTDNFNIKEISVLLLGQKTYLTHTQHIEVEELLNGAHILIWPDVFQFIKDSLALIIVWFLLFFLTAGWK